MSNPTITRNMRPLDNFGIISTQTTSPASRDSNVKSYEVAVVMDIILDETHPIFQKKKI